MLSKFSLFSYYAFPTAIDIVSEVEAAADANYIRIFKQYKNTAYSPQADRIQILFGLIPF